MIASPGFTLDEVSDAVAATQCRDPGVVVVGSLSDSAEDFFGLRRIVRSARRLLDVLGDEMPGSVLDLERSQALALLFGDRSAEAMEAFVDRTLGPLRCLDPDDRPNLIGTLETYLAEAGSPRRTASALHVHVNTVYYRLEKIKEALGADLTGATTTLHLRMACLVCRLVGTRGQHRSA